jgi:GYF domain 2
MMADRNWYTGINGRQDGPYSDEQLRALIASGRVTGDTLVWATGMENWTTASAIPGLMGNAQRPPPIPSPAAALPPGALQAFSTDVRVWPLIGRSIVVVLAQLLILPAPWAFASFYRWFVEHLQVPGHSRVAFAGKAEDIWYVFMLNALLGYAGLINQYLPLVAFFLGPLFALLISRWFVRNLIWEGQTAPLRFTATYWPLLGWYLLFAVSVFSIIGWAWVCTAWTRWICRRVEGGTHRLVCTMSGWGLLWRTVLFSLSCIFIVPIPWTLRWFIRWIVSRFAIAGAGPQPAA